MTDLLNFPVPFFAFCLAVLWISVYAGVQLRRRRRIVDEDERQDLGIVLSGTLTLLGLIIGFSFSMAVSRYDQRKNYEEDEANAIGTEYVRAGLLPTADATKARQLLRSYLDRRIAFYTAGDERELEQVDASTAQLQTALWSAVQAPAAARPTPVTALAVSGMNDVLNSQGYTQAAWWNRIPLEAWGLMGAISICCNLLLGYNARRSEGKIRHFFRSTAASVDRVLSHCRHGQPASRPYSSESAKSAKPRAFFAEAMIGLGDVLRLR